MNSQTVEFLEKFSTDIKYLDISVYNKNLSPDLKIALGLKDGIRINTQVLTGILDLSRFTQLENLICISNCFTMIISIPLTIQYINCTGNSLFNIELTKDHVNLQELDCSHNQITKLNISSNNITKVICNNNNLETLTIKSTSIHDDIFLCCCNNKNCTITNISSNVKCIHTINNYWCNSYFNYKISNGYDIPNNIFESYEKAINKDTSDNKNYQEDYEEYNQNE